MKKSQISDAKKRIIDQFEANSSQGLVRSLSQIAFAKNLSDEFNVQEQFKNLQNPLLFHRNHKIQALIDQTEDASQKLQHQMNEMSEFSKVLYKKMISNEDYVGFFKNQKSLAPQKVDRITIEQLLKTQKYLRQLTKKKDESTLMKQRYIKAANKKTAEQLRRVKVQKNYKHTNNKDKQNLPELINTDAGYQDFKAMTCGLTKVEDKSNEILKLLNIEKMQFDPGYIQLVNLPQNRRIDELMSLFDFRLLKDSNQFGQNSKQLYFDFQNNLNFWSGTQESSNNLFLMYSLNMNPALKKQPKKQKDQQILRSFTQFRLNRLSLNSVCEVSMGKIKPEMLNSYFNLKQQHYAKMQSEKRDHDLDEKYRKLEKQYINAQQLRLKDNARRIPIKLANTDCQTLKEYDQKKAHKYYDNYETVQDILIKIKKVNRIREKVMQNKNNKSKFVILKNACLQVNDLLFKLLLFMLTGEKFGIKGRKMDDKVCQYYFTYSDLINSQNKQEAERRVLQLVYTNVNNFEVDSVDDFPKKKIISIYVEQRQKNNKLLQIVRSEQS